MDPDSKRLTVTVTDGRGRRVADGGLARWLARVAPVRPHGDVAIALVTDAHIRKLNRTYRGKDYATDVLSFPAEDTPESVASGFSRKATSSRKAAETDPGFPGPRPADRGPRFWGDLVIATGVARRQARAAGHPYRTELRVLALHGFLHLLGYDHDAPDDRGRMARAEARLRRRGGLPAGLIGRAKAAR